MYASFIHKKSFEGSGESYLWKEEESMMKCRTPPDAHIVLVISLLLAVVGLIMGVQSGTQDQVCPTLLRAGDSREEEGLYLNIDSPIDCSGTATGWHFCYYPKDWRDSSGYKTSYNATFAAYRKTGGKFELIHGTETLVVKEAGDTSFHCEFILLDTEVDINEEVIVGVCLPSRRPLSVLSGRHGQTLLYGNSELCNSRDIRVSDLEDVGDLILHAALHIIMPAEQFRSDNTVVTEGLTPTSAHMITDVAISTDPTSLTPDPMHVTTDSFRMAVSTRQATTTSTAVAPTTAAVHETHTPPANTVPQQTRRHSLTESLRVPATDSSYAPNKTVSIEGSRSSSQPTPIVGISFAAAVIPIVAIASSFLVVFVYLKRRKRGSQHSGRENSVTVSISAAQIQMPEIHMTPQETQQFSTGMPPPPPHYEFDRRFFQNVLTPHYEFDTALTSPLSTEFRETEGDHLDRKQNRSFQYQNEAASVHYSLLDFGTMNQAAADMKTESPYVQPGSTERELQKQLEDQNIAIVPRKEIRILSSVGDVQFGMVWRGIWGQAGDVAVKTLGSQSESRVKLLQEAAIMGQFFHPNVIRLLGVVMEDASILVMEFASGGDLGGHLNSMNHNPGQLPPTDTPKVFLCYSQQIAFGMQYLAGKGFVHRDLAARNILLTEGNVCKIADFGMTRDLANENYYVSHGGKIPVKWTAPEAVYYGKYSTASDAWSYGCLLYEIWSLGKTPFGGCSNRETLEKLGTGYRLPPPPGCPRVIYEIMILCWHPEPPSRPKFRDLLLELIEPENEVLKIPEDALSTHRLAGMLGGFLEMYRDLQDVYRSSEAAR